MTLELVVNLKGAVRRDEEAGAFVSYCPALCLHSQGDTQEEAFKALKSAVRLYLLACYERGQLDRALREAGFDSATTTNVPATPDDRMKEWIAIREKHYENTLEFSVPLHLIAAQQASAECRH